MQRYKLFARALSSSLALSGQTLKHGHALECVAALHNLPNWDTFCARADAPMLDAPAASVALQRKWEHYGIRLEPEETKKILLRAVWERRLALLRDVGTDMAARSAVLIQEYESRPRPKKGDPRPPVVAPALSIPKSS